MLLIKKRGGGETIKYEPHYDRKLNTSHTPYFEGRPHEEMMILKLGQRKLFFNELELYTLFLERYALKKGVTVVYAGAASGIHSTLLAKIFSSFEKNSGGNEWHFHYYDTNPFSEDLKKYSNIHLYNQYFTEKEAKHFYEMRYEKKNKSYLIFLSDIRSGTFEDAVERDMAMQREWVKIMKPDLTMLKFRLPWREGKTTYFDGEIYTQPRIGPTSTETRLISFSPASFSPNGEKENEKEYDNNLYNDQCFFWQRYQRCAFHEIDDFKKLTSSSLLNGKEEKINGLCHCYDCWSEIKIIKEFLKVYNSLFFTPSFDPLFSCCEKRGTQSAKEEKSEKKEIVLPSFLQSKSKKYDIKDETDIIVLFMKKIDKHTKSSLNIPPHNLMVNEHDINKKKKLLANITTKYFDSLLEKFD